MMKQAMSDNLTPLGMIRYRVIKNRKLKNI